MNSLRFTSSLVSENDCATGAVPGSRSLALSLALVPSLFIAGGLHAQTATQSETPAAPKPDAEKDAVVLDPVDVHGDRVTTPQLSSPKFTAPLLDTPQTVAVVPQEVFSLQNAQNLSDVLRNTPGITFTAGEGGAVSSGDTFTMRGFDASGSVFVDGVRNSSAAYRDVYNVEQVEIAKGPSGADTGRGGASGYVNLVTKTPKLETFTRGSASYGASEDAGKDQRRLTLDTNQTLGDALPTSAVRLNLLAQDSGVAGRDFIESNRWGVSPSFTHGLGTATRVTLAFDYQEQRNIPDSGVPAAAVSEGIYRDPAGASNVLVPAASPLAADIFGNFYGLAGDYEDVEQRSALLRIEHDFTPDLRLSNQTKLGDTRREATTSFINNAAAFNPVTNLVTVNRSHVETENKIASNQTNLTARFDTGFVAHTLNTGLELTREEQFAPTFTSVAGPATDVYSPDPYRVVGPAQIPFRAANNPFTEASIDTAAIYAFDTLELHEKLLFNLSGRIDKYRSEFDSLTAANVSAHREDKGTLLTWKTGLVFKPRPEGSLYAAYGSSMTPPGTNLTFSTTAGNANDPGIEPQEAENYEVGVKWEFFNSRLSTNLAAYRSINGNVATNIGTTAVPVIVYDQEQRAEGLEFGVSGRITPEWLVFGGVGYIETEIDSPSTATTNGSSLRFTPRLSGSLFTTYALTKRLTIGGGGQYSETVSRSNNLAVTGSTSTAYDTYLIVDVPSYWLFNALASYAVNDHLTLRMNVANLLDEKYYSVNNNGARLIPGGSRTWTLSADYSF